MQYLLIFAVCGFLLNEVSSFEYYIPDYEGVDPEGPIDNPFWECFEDRDCEEQQSCVDEFGMRICRNRPTTTSTSTTTTTTTTTKPPPTFCAPPVKTAGMDGYFCFDGHNKNSICIANCKEHCFNGDPMTECKCDANSCWWSANPAGACKVPKDECQTNTDCQGGKSCVQRCGKKCEYAIEDPENPKCNCHSDRDCKSNQVCDHDMEEEECGTCRTICSRPCGQFDSCDEGYICKHLPCGRECVALPKLPSCPFLNAGTYPRPNCRYADNCESDEECRHHGVCCYSTECGRNICLSRDETDDCVDKEDLVCSSSADCTPRQICHEDSGGCYQCSKGFSCPDVAGYCLVDGNCKSTEACIPNRDGCLTCQPAPEGRPAVNCEKPCVTDDVCPEMMSCVRKPDGCKKCDFEEYY